VADCIAAYELLDGLLTAEILHGDKGHDSNAVRQKIERKGAVPDIPTKTNRRWMDCFSRLKDFRPMVTGYDRLARNFLRRGPLGRYVL
jgi:hypothetical protein